MGLGSILSEVGSLWGPLQVSISESNRPVLHFGFLLAQN